jgi:hypothetical protein
MLPTLNVGQVSTDIKIEILNQFHEVVSKVASPLAQSVIFERLDGEHLISKDGYSLIKNLTLNTKVNSDSLIISYFKALESTLKSVANNVHMRAGDGTTSALLVSINFLKLLLTEGLSNSYPTEVINKTISAITTQIIDEIKRRSTPIKDVTDVMKKQVVKSLITTSLSNTFTGLDKTLLEAYSLNNFDVKKPIVVVRDDVSTSYDLAVKKESGLKFKCRLVGSTFGGKVETFQSTAIVFIDFELGNAVLSVDTILQTLNESTKHDSLIIFTRETNLIDKRLEGLVKDANSLFKNCSTESKAKKVFIVAYDSNSKSEKEELEILGLYAGLEDEIESSEEMNSAKAISIFDQSNIVECEINHKKQEIRLLASSGDETDTFKNWKVELKNEVQRLQMSSASENSAYATKKFALLDRIEGDVVTISIPYLAYRQSYVTVFDLLHDAIQIVKHTFENGNLTKPTNLTVLEILYDETFENSVYANLSGVLYSPLVVSVYSLFKEAYTQTLKDIYKPLNTLNQSFLEWSDEAFEAFTEESKTTKAKFNDTVALNVIERNLILDLKELRFYHSTDVSPISSSSLTDETILSAISMIVSSIMNNDTIVFVPTLLRPENRE